MSSKPVNSTEEALRLFRDYYNNVPYGPRTNRLEKLTTDVKKGETGSRLLELGGPRSNLFRPRKDANGNVIVRSGPGYYDLKGFDDGTYKSIDIFIDPERPFTGTITARDAATGLLKETTLGADTAAEWVGLYIIAYNLLVRQYNAALQKAVGTQAKRAAQREFLGDKRTADIEKLYKQIQLVSASKGLDKATRDATKNMLQGLTALMQVEVAPELAAAMSDYDMKQLDDVVSEIEADRSASPRTLSDAQAIEYLTYIARVGTASKDARAKDVAAQAAALRDEIKANQASTVRDAVKELSDAIERFPAFETRKKLIAATNSYLGTKKDIVIPTRAVAQQTYGANGEAAIAYYAGLARMQTVLSKEVQDQIKKGVASNYGYLSQKVGFGTASAGPFADKTKLFPKSLVDANKAQSYLSGKGMLNVCDTISPTEIQNFIQTYTAMHDLIVTTLVFYYSSCKAALDGTATTGSRTDVTPLARDWLRWLGGAPFHYKTKELRNMNVDDWNKVAPQNWLRTFDSEAPATFGAVESDMEKLKGQATVIIEQCGIAKTPLSDYDQRMLFLAKFAYDFTAKFSDIYGGAARWELSPADGKVYLVDSAGLREYCTRNAKESTYPSLAAAPAEESVVEAAVVPEAGVQATDVDLTFVAPFLGGTVANYNALTQAQKDKFELDLEQGVSTLKLLEPYTAKLVDAVNAGAMERVNEAMDIDVGSEVNFYRSRIDAMNLQNPIPGDTKWADIAGNEATKTIYFAVTSDASE